MAKHTNQPLPGAPFLFPQGATKIRQNKQIVREPLFAKGAASNAPTTRTSRKAERKRFVLVNVVTSIEPELLCTLAKQFVHWLAEQSFAGAVDET